MGNYLYAFDLSMKCSGVAIFDLETLQPIHIGSIETSDKQSHGKRLKQIEDEVVKLTEKYPPKYIAIERGFSRFNTSTQVIYRVHGVINKFFHDIEQTYYPPKTVKEVICRGDATKKYVRETIEKVYPNVQFKNEDESDAFAVGLCFLIKNKYIQWNKEEIKKLFKGKKK